MFSLRTNTNSTEGLAVLTCPGYVVCTHVFTVRLAVALLVETITDCYCCSRRSRYCCLLWNTIRMLRDDHYTVETDKLSINVGVVCTSWCCPTYLPSDFGAST